MVLGAILRLWNLLNLARFPEAQEALRREVLEVLGPSAHFTREKLAEMRLGMAQNSPKMGRHG